MIRFIWRALRGGSCYVPREHLRPSYRGKFDRLTRSSNFGFRLVVHVKGEGMVDVPKS